jgi:hypothetical protein
VRDRDAAPSTCTSRSLALKTITHAASHAKHVVLEAILAHVTLLAHANVAVLAVESVRTKRSEAQVREHESTIALLYGRRYSQSP